MFICDKCLHQNYTIYQKTKPNVAEKCEVCQGVYMCHYIANREDLQPKGQEPPEDQLTYDEFVKRYVIPNKLWKFNLFKIKCVKCDNEEVEFNSHMEIDHGYYPEDQATVDGKIIVKCHGCGNAFTLDFNDLER